MDGVAVVAFFYVLVIMWLIWVAVKIFRLIQKRRDKDKT